MKIRYNTELLNENFLKHYKKSKIILHTHTQERKKKSGKGKNNGKLKFIGT